jgi:hypothetical protein
MSQFPHDKFAKDLFDLLLTPLGNVNLQRTIAELETWLNQLRVDSSNPQ